MPVGISRVWFAPVAMHHIMVDYIITGIREGFRIGFDATHLLLKCKKNMRSAYEHPNIVDKQLLKDCSQGYMLGPFDPAELTQVHTSRIGVIPKSTSPGNGAS